ncbi:hypothetical protein FEM48_Zijuj11G0109500 [Ziziphus jujuba var. spinosa]|uniref:RING-type domain-containing protein n=1 Tax=Ziziphus jujuba var. spinosa TaxID=714518 RepID=A0A978UIJ7_ZIZJJ|nr:hypothetical protein FEM48_Zijuj11G0109500 [Ziziphus jujuba var. spinosa]
MEEPSRSSGSSTSAFVRGDSSAAATTSSSGVSQVREEDDGGDRLQEYHRFPHHDVEENQQITNSYRGNFGLFGGGDETSSVVGDDTWSCVIVLLTFWFFVSMTLILGVYGSVTLELGPNCSLLLRPNPLFVQSIKVLKEQNESKAGPMLYGFYRSPPLDILKTWSQRHNLSVPTDSHTARSDGLAQWLEDPTYPNSTLSWNIIHGSGIIQQDIFKSSSYYVAVGNLNSERVEVQLNLTIKAFLYNTTGAYYKCTFTQGTCSMNILFPKGNAAVLTSPGLEQGGPIDEWNIKLYYGPRWATYIVGIGGLTVIMLLLFNFLNKFQCTHGDGTRGQYEVIRPEREPLLSNKDDDLSSWGSSYDSVSHDEDDLEEFLALGPHEGKSLGDGENSNNTRRLCAICFDAPRDCFFLPCGHCVACFACGTRQIDLHTYPARIAEVDGTCPICRRNMRKVRKIFTV